VACKIDGEAMENEPETSRKAEPAEIVIFPNPGDGHFTLRGINSEEQSLVQIYSSSGQLVHSEVVVPGTESLLISLDDKAEGLYLIRIENAERIQELRYVKQ
jgi:hypothetical protein